MDEKKPGVFGRLAQNRRRIIAIACAVVILAGGIGTWHARAARSQGSGFLTATAAYGDIAVTVSANATVEPTQETVLSFKNSGYVQNVNVTTGQFVKAGAVLASEQASDYQAQLDQAEANLESAQAAYQKAVATQPDQINQAKAALDQDKNKLALDQTTYEQDQALFAAGAVSRSTLDSARNTYQNDQAAVESAQAALDEAQSTAAITQAAASVKTAQAGVTLAENNLAGSQISATMDGYVVAINGNAGEYSEGGAPSSSSSSSSSSSQFTITLSSNKLELLAEINEADMAKVKTGQKATFTVDAFAGKTFTGTVTSLAAEATQIQNVEYYDSYVSIDDQTGLKAGMPATVNVISASDSHVLLLPRTALDYGATAAKGRSGSYVVVLSQGQPQLTAVKTGLGTNSQVEITGGLTAGQTVVLGRGGLSGSGSSSTKSNTSTPHFIPGVGPIGG